MRPCPVDGWAMKRQAKILTALAVVSAPGLIFASNPFATDIRLEGSADTYDPDAFDQETYRQMRDLAHGHGAVVLRCEVSEHDEHGVTASRTVWDARGRRTIFR